MSNVLQEKVDVNGNKYFEGTMDVNIKTTNGATPNMAMETGGNLAAAKVDLDSILAALTPKTTTQTYTTSADMRAAAAITPAPAAGKKIVAIGIIVSTDTAMVFDVEMETSHNVLATVYLGVNATAFIPLPITGDAADKKLFGKASLAGNVSVTAVTYSM